MLFLLLFRIKREVPAQPFSAVLLSDFSSGKETLSSAYQHSNETLSDLRVVCVCPNSNHKTHGWPQMNCTFFATVLVCFSPYHESNTNPSHNFNFVVWNVIRQVVTLTKLVPFAVCRLKDQTQRTAFVPPTLPSSCLSNKNNSSVHNNTEYPRVYQFVHMFVHISFHEAKASRNVQWVPHINVCAFLAWAHLQVGNWVRPFQ